MLKFIVVQMYYERYKMVRKCVESLRDQTYSNWEYGFCDDGSINPGEPVVRELMGEQINKVKFYNTKDTVETKTARPGSMIGHYMNQAVLDSDADIVVGLNDDDYLVLDYLEKLNVYYMEHPEVLYSFCHIIPYSPVNIYATFGTPHWLNKTGSIQPSCLIDWSQLSFRASCLRRDGILFPFPQTACHDSYMYERLYRRYGACPFNGIVGQYKGLFPNQMGNRHGDQLMVVRDV